MSITLKQAYRIYSKYLQRESKRLHDGGSMLKSLKRHEHTYPKWHRQCVLDYAATKGWTVSYNQVEEEKRGIIFDDIVLWCFMAAWPTFCLIILLK